MRVSKGLQKLLANFVFRDSRLESHPKLMASNVYFASGESYLDLVAAVSKHRPRFEGLRLPIDGSLTGLVWKNKEAVVVPDIDPPDPRIYRDDSLKGLTAQSLLAVPIGDGSDVIGVLNLISTEKGF